MTDEDVELIDAHANTQSLIQNHIFVFLLYVHFALCFPRSDTNSLVLIDDDNE
jgi:hypothetical protein